MVRISSKDDPEAHLYALTEDAKTLSPIMQSLYDWVEARGALAMS